MAHNNKIQDTEKHFRIDPETRSITNEQSSNNTIIQYDHASERFTFDMPRYVDSHDMSEVSEIRIHYRNVASSKSPPPQTYGVYIPDDIEISKDDENIITFSWLLSSVTTQYAGHLYFSIQFLCLDGETIVYAWNTGIYKDISVIESINNTEEVVVDNVDVLEQWRQELFEAGGDAVVNVNVAKDNAISEIEAKGAETIDSISDVCSDLSKSVDENGEVVSRNSKRIANLEQGFTASAIDVDDTIAYVKNIPMGAPPYAEVLKVGGMTRKCTNLIPYPYEDTTFAKNGLTFTDNGDGSLTVNGTTTSQVFFYLKKSLTLPAGTYYLSGCPKGGGWSTYVLLAQIGSTNYADAGLGRTIELSESKTLKMSFTAYAGSTFNNVTIYPVLNEGTTALPYEHFFEGLRSTPVTEVESVGENVRNTLPIPETVQALDGYGWGINDACYNYIDWEKRQLVKRVGRVDLGTLKYSIDSGTFYSTLIDYADNNNVLTASYTLRKTFAECVANDKSIYAIYNKKKFYINDSAYTDPEAFKAAMSGVMLYYELATPEITDISDILSADNLISVEGGGIITFKNEYEYNVPSEVMYQVKTQDTGSHSYLVADDGTKIYFGTAVSQEGESATTITGAVTNDQYVNITTWKVYKLMNTGVWVTSATLAN